MARITKEVFLKYLEANKCLHSQTAKAIRQGENVTMSRQAVYKRAKNYPKEVEAIIESLVDKAESSLSDLMNSAKNENVKLKAIIFYLQTKGKDRGYIIDENVNVKGTLTDEKKINLEEIPADILLKIKEKQDSIYNKKE